MFAKRTNWNLDRKSTRLNSSHVRISYAVFCLKKKKTHTEQPPNDTDRWLRMYCIVSFFISCALHRFLFFFFNDTATTEIYTLSLHDALPISYNARVTAQEGRDGLKSAPTNAAVPL